jgi:hypothetical protein
MPIALISTALEYLGKDYEILARERDALLVENQSLRDQAREHDRIRFCEHMGPGFVDSEIQRGILISLVEALTAETSHLRFLHSCLMVVQSFIHFPRAGEYDGLSSENIQIDSWGDYREYKLIVASVESRVKALSDKLMGINSLLTSTSLADGDILRRVSDSLRMRDPGLDEEFRIFLKLIQKFQINKSQLIEKIRNRNRKIQTPWKPPS